MAKCSNLCPRSVYRQHCMIEQPLPFFSIIHHNKRLRQPSCSCAAPTDGASAALQSFCSQPGCQAASFQVDKVSTKTYMCVFMPCYTSPVSLIYILLSMCIKGKRCHTTRFKLISVKEDAQLYECVHILFVTETQVSYVLKRR